MFLPCQLFQIHITPSVVSEVEAAVSGRVIPSERSNASNFAFSDACAAALKAGADSKISAWLEWRKDRHYEIVRQ
jgi:hypothetical protein